LSTDDQSRLAQELLRKGDVEAAIAILEDLAAQEPLREDLVPMLVDAHTRYAQMIAMNRHASPEALNHVLYSHYMRILELEPENLEAQAGLQSVKMWFESHGMTLPEQVDPILFLPKTGDESAEDETDGTEGEGSSEEDQ
jgi:precorrin-2 methylase